METFLHKRQQVIGTEQFMAVFNQIGLFNKVELILNNNQSLQGEIVEISDEEQLFGTGYPLKVPLIIKIRVGTEDITIDTLQIKKAIII